MTVCKKNAQDANYELENSGCLPNHGIFDTKIRRRIGMAKYGFSKRNKVLKKTGNIVRHKGMCTEMSSNIHSSEIIDNFLKDEAT